MNQAVSVPAAVVLLGALACSTVRQPSGTTAHLESSDRKSVLRRILPQNVRLFVFEGDQPRRSASGVVIGSESTPDGAFSYVLTSAHAVEHESAEEPRMVVYVDRDGDSFDYSARSVAVGRVPELDLALIRVRGVSLAAAELAEDGDLEAGEDVVVVAAPYGKSLSVSGGLISQVEWDRKSGVPAMLKTDAAIGYGASGGGVYSASSGKLLAIVEGYRTARVGFAVAEQSYSFDVPMPGETFAAPTAKVRAFLESSGFGRFVSRSGQGAEASRAALR